ncbi:hypothetical protein [Streptomyces sp. NBC_00470]|uniref:hypothetical protein n=1 Tax=Streptomyces sp. NBC_00470 TaxID=2975753 RepID=UPI002F91888A
MPLSTAPTLWQYLVIALLLLATAAVILCAPVSTRTGVDYLYYGAYATYFALTTASALRHDPFAVTAGYALVGLVVALFVYAVSSRDADADDGTDPEGEGEPRD